MVEIALRPRGPYSLALSMRLAGDATRRVREGLVTARCCGALARAWQSPDGTVTIRSDSVAAAEKLRWTLALDDLFQSLPDEVWARPVRTGAGDEHPVALLPFTRWWEVEVHLVDLGLTIRSSDWTDGLVNKALPRLLAGLPGRADERELMAWLLGRGPAPELQHWM
jgi:hypothetical protein